MENASKALLIAGAVLIVILIIGVGMAIFNAGQGGIDSAISQMGAQEQQIFNSQFTSYEGTQKGSKLRTLINTVISNNAQADESGTPVVKIKLGSGVATIDGWTADGETDESRLASLRSKLITSKSYKVSFGYDNGVINVININL